MGLVKFDLLGLGMLTALHRCIDLIATHHGVEVDLATLPQDPAVYDMLCRADSVGVFQVESRAHMATLPRLKPRCFSDLAVEVALIRPGPIQGDSVHPYLRRRNGDEADQLRAAMGSKRSSERMWRLRDRLFAGMAERGITGEVAEIICDRGRPERIIRQGAHTRASPWSSIRT